LPDFLGTIYQIGRKIYQMAVNIPKGQQYYKWPKNLPSGQKYTHFKFQGPTKFT
jgi:hypothetical protein